MARTPVFPTEPSALDLGDSSTPNSAIEALMETPPFYEPPLSKEELLPAMDAAVAALDVLNERERWIVYARIWRRLSVRQVGVELNLSKTHVDRIYKSALAKLAAELRSSGAAMEFARLIGRADDEFTSVSS